MGKIDLEALRARGLPRVTATAVFNIHPAGDGELPTTEQQAEIDRTMAAADAYLRAFATLPNDEGGEDTRCLNCGRTLTGFLGAFRWGIVHGEGACIECGYPARAYHRIRDDSGATIMSFSAILQYHPDVLAYPEEKEA